MPKVLISDNLNTKAKEILVSHNIDTEVSVGLNPEELKKTITDCDGLIIRSSTQVTEELINAAKNLKVIGRAGIGVDNINLESATANGIVVMNTPYGNSITTAEHTIAMILSLVRSIPQANSSTHAGIWEKTKYTGTELYGKTLGMIGCGNIGSIVAELAIGLKMKVIVFDPYLTANRIAELGLEKISLEELYKRSDIITLHTPLNDSTRGIININSINKMKEGVRIINCARGGLIIENDLRTAIESGQVAGAAIDVFEIEPAKNNCLFGLPQVIATPHLGASTSEAQENVAVQVAEQVAEYLINGSVTNAINIPSVSKEEMPKLKPYMNLANKIGKLAGQISSTSITNATITYSGYVSKINTQPLTACILEGLLSPRMSTVNMVNAPLIAKQRNINVSTTYNDSAGDFMTKINLSINTENMKRTVTGTLFANLPRIVEIMGIKIDAALGKNMLFVTNADQPGFIGALGSLLGKENINIGTFNLGRTKQSENAIALIETDEPVSKEIVAIMERLPNVQSVKALKF